MADRFDTRMAAAPIVKICGITRTKDAQLALSAGADWIGLNLVGGPRRISDSECLSILRALDDPSRAVALLRFEADSPPVQRLTDLRDAGVRRLQIYGEGWRWLGRLRKLGFQTIGVHHVGPAASLRELSERLSAPAAQRPAYVLLDASAQGLEGGTGRTLDWNAIRQHHRTGRMDDWPPWLLAGGLTAANVADAIRTVRPCGVDVSTGVEISPGRKDPEKVRAFIQAAHTAQSE